jgi:peroxiredoxin Q/BCP
MSLIQIGAAAPKFNLLNQDGNPVSLDNFPNQWRVVYFYPKASTPGCTVQACGIRDSTADLRNLGVEVLGISPDAPAKLKKFAQAQSLPFTLLSDPDHAVAEAFGVWALKKFMGKTFMGVVRTTFIIDPQGNLASILNDFKTSNHHQVLLAALKGLQAA